VVLTNPQIGNYGANATIRKRASLHRGLIVREFSRWPSNWRSEEAAGRFSKKMESRWPPGDRHSGAGVASTRAHAGVLSAANRRS